MGVLRWVYCSSTVTHEGCTSPGWEHPSTKHSAPLNPEPWCTGAGRPGPPGWEHPATQLVSAVGTGEGGGGSAGDVDVAWCGVVRCSAVWCECLNRVRYSGYLAWLLPYSNLIH